MGDGELAPVNPLSHGSASTPRSAPHEPLRNGGWLARPETETRQVRVSLAPSTGTQSLSLSFPSEARQS